jgi:ring-1,2-phenylacetyl-CoA epoxidase subunit PaaD
MNAQIDISPREIHKIWDILSTVSDPEIPVLSVIDLGVVRSFTLKNKEFEVQSEIDDFLNSVVLNKNNDSKIPDEILESALEVVITPTYSGCPAMHMIASNIRFELLAQGFKNIKIIEKLSPAWTTDWMTQAGKNKLNEYGIAPPNTANTAIKCPQCASENTELLSEFGSTSCKSLYRCKDCLEPFDYFKCH